MSIATFTKEELTALLTILHRVEIKGLNEAKALLHLGSKLEAGINAEATKVEAHVGIAEPTHQA